jgi:hypothetical protein
LIIPGFHCGLRAQAQPIINDPDQRRPGMRGGIFGKAAKAWHMGRAGLTFARLYMIPTKSNAIPVEKPA